ncbi:NAD(P)H-quinone oxidoreductase [Gordonia sp. X0973]|uniref:NAD(P)H-quinone oxidoreductase n=1 Tax=Gordonia sp. X0973 TaxID=2742602 RepID=UPI000F53548A|nr:NAD(P)H-quinone oxidoreductase [Gordonia sp. X0973]QKT05889.1 NAD(P)H-quinone oxidoreductase [Gordonia sp. X0973]
MRAIACHDGEFTVEDVPTPAIANNEVLIRVAAAGVNRADLLQRRGLYPPPPGASAIIGLEVSGTITQVGAHITEFRVGDQVCALLAGGGYAEFVAVPAAQVIPLPTGISLHDAAAIPEVACTVVSNLILTAHLQRDELLLIHGGSSGIGTHAIQLAKHLGARVAVTARTRDKLDFCRELGADILINYADEDFVEVIKEAGGADVILDIIGAKYLERNVEALNTGGRLVIIGMQGGVKGELNIAQLMGKRASVIGTTLRARPTYGPGGKAEVVAKTLELTLPLLSNGTIKPIIDSSFPLADAAAAHDRLDSGDAIGKVLLTVDE